MKKQKQTRENEPSKRKQGKKDKGRGPREVNRRDPGQRGAGRRCAYAPAQQPWGQPETPPHGVGPFMHLNSSTSCKDGAAGIGN